MELWILLALPWVTVQQVISATNVPTLVRYLRTLSSLGRYTTRPCLKRTPMRGLASLVHLRASFFLACTVYAYSTSLKANKNAAVMTLCVTLGPIPVFYQHLATPNSSLYALTSVQASVPLLADNPLKRGAHTVPLIPLARDVHAALDRDVRVGDTRSEQLAQRAHVERIFGCDPPLLLEEVLHLLEHGVLQDGVDHQDQRGSHAGEQAQGSLLADQREQRGERGGRLGGRGSGQYGLVRVVLARRHARVDHPDGVREQHGG